MIWDYSYIECCGKVSTVREREAPGWSGGGYIQNHNVECPFQKLQNPQKQGAHTPKGRFQPLSMSLKDCGEPPRPPLPPGEELDMGAQSYPMRSLCVKPLAPGWHEPIHLPRVSCRQADKEHPAQPTLLQTHLAETVCIWQDLIFLVSSEALNAIALNQSHIVRWQSLNKIICNSGYPALHTNRLDSTITNSSYLKIDHLRHML